MTDLSDMSATLLQGRPSTDLSAVLPRSADAWEAILQEAFRGEIGRALSLTGEGLLHETTKQELLALARARGLPVVDCRLDVFRVLFEIDKRYVQEGTP